MNIEPHKMDVPASLAGELRGLYRTPVPVGGETDEAMLGLARERAMVAARRAVVVRRLTRWGLVAAAGLAVGVFLTVRTAWPTRPTVGGAVALVGDVNGDGVVDILDALVLERAVEGKAALSRAWDVNGDGVVNRADVDRVAMAAVSLTPKAGGHG